MKNNENRVRVNKGLQHWLSGQPAEVQQHFLHMVRSRSSEFKEAFAIDKLGAMMGVHALIDEVMVRSNRENSCKKGCAFCCHINVDVTDPEAALIAQHCREKNIKVDVNYLHERLRNRKMEVALSKAAACVFLKNNECSIYEVRPLACRSYLVVNEPQYCDAVTYRPPAHGTLVVNDPYVELELSALYDALKAKNAERMERMLLRYFK